MTQTAPLPETLQGEMSSPREHYLQGSLATIATQGFIAGGLTCEAHMSQRVLTEASRRSNLLSPEDNEALEADPLVHAMRTRWETARKQRNIIEATTAATALLVVRVATLDAPEYPGLQHWLDALTERHTTSGI